MKIAIIYYSTYGHNVTMAETVKEGVAKAGTAEVQIFQVPETLPQEILDQLHAPPKADYPIATLDTLTDYDAFIFGIPTRFGNLPAQMTDFWGQTGGLWASGALQGKPVAMFSSSSSPGGGHETTLRNFLSYVAHHGMIYIPLGYANAFAELSNMEEIHGGTPYGASTFAGSDGSRTPSEIEKKIAFVQGETFTATALKFVGSKSEKETKKENAAEPEKAATGSRAAQSSPTTKKEESSGCAKCILM